MEWLTLLRTVPYNKNFTISYIPKNIVFIANRCNAKSNFFYNAFNFQNFNLITDTVLPLVLAT
jgi:hypothetical protein